MPSGSGCDPELTEVLHLCLHVWAVRPFCVSTSQFMFSRNRPDTGEVVLCVHTEERFTLDVHPSSPVLPIITETLQILLTVQMFRQWWPVLKYLNDIQLKQGNRTRVLLGREQRKPLVKYNFNWSLKAHILQMLQMFEGRR